jgi:hypothetical protein
MVREHPGTVDAPQGSVVEARGELVAAVLAHPRLRSFRSLLASAELLGDLVEPIVFPRVLLAPTNEAMALLPAELGRAMFERHHMEALIDLAENHVAEPTGTLGPTISMCTLLGEELTLTEQGVLEPYGARVLECKVTGDGVLLVLDTMLVRRAHGSCNPRATH